MQHNSLLNNHHPDIGVLLEKYFDGETTLDDEKILKAYFNASGVAPEHQAMTPLFQMLNQEKAAVMPDLSSRKGASSFQRSGGPQWPKFMAAAATMLLLITAAAWWWNTKPVDLVTDQPIAMVPSRDDKGASQDADSKLRWDEKGASKDDKDALVNKKRKNKIRKETQPVLTSQIDPETEAAMEEIKAAFALISSKINKGRKEATKGLKEIERMEKGIEKIKENS